MKLASIPWALNMVYIVLSEKMAVLMSVNGRSKLNNLKLSTIDIHYLP